MSFDYNSIVEELSSPQHCIAAQTALRERRSYAVGEARLLGAGGFGYVWALGEKAVLKIYHAGLNGGDPRPFIQEEWDTHQALNVVPDSPTPKLLASSFVPPETYNGVIGWAAFSRIPGRHLTWEEDQTNTKRALWGSRFAAAAVDFEKALSAAPTKPAFWNRSTKDLMLLHLKQTKTNLSADDRQLIEDLGNYIEKEGSKNGKKRYLHGDLHEGNALLNPEATRLRLFDPSIKFDYPESNVRYNVPHDMGYVAAFTKTYVEQTGVVLNEKLVLAFAALDKTRNALIKKDMGAGQDAQVCLDRLANLDPDWRQPREQACIFPHRPRGSSCPSTVKKTTLDS